MDDRKKFETTSQFQPVEVDYIDTCAILIKNDVIHRIGGMDGRYFINFDDLDFNVRSKRAGFKIVYVPAARMWHRVSSSMGIASPGTTYYMTRNALLFFWSHAPGVWKIIDVLLLITRTIRTILAWNLKPGYRNDDKFSRKSAANLFALRDFCFGRFGKMGQDVHEACYPDQVPAV
jgi:GT2 family glycosyltransferase